MRISIATPKAYRYACLKFHYAKSVPSVQYAFNVFNDSDEWCGCILYGVGAAINIGKPFGMMQGEILELVRVALNGKQGHGNTSKAVAMTMRELRKIDPLIRMLVSYADADQQHTGIIYQATNWIYIGNKQEAARGFILLNGKKTHPKSIYSRYGTSSIKWLKEHVDPNAQEVITEGKRKYVYFFDKQMRKEWMKKAQPYPKTEKEGENNAEEENSNVDAGASRTHPAEG